jgi:hypothetical protein
VLFFVLFASFVGTGIWGVWQPAVRIAQVEVRGGEEELLTLYATQALEGSYALSIPRDSIFFFPASRIRSSILAEHPTVGAVSISRTSLTSILVTIVERVPLGRWCGLSPTEGGEEYCYLFDASGFVFATAATSSPVIHTFRTYAPLKGDTLEPLRATLTHSDLLPPIFNFARQFSSRIAPVSAVKVVGDEVHLFLESGARLLYVINDEHRAFQAVLSAEDTTDLADESLEYIDVRFEGKVYLKRKK